MKRSIVRLGCRSLAALCLCTPAGIAQTVSVLDFDGTLPAGAVLTRSSARPDGQGITIGPDDPRWTTTAVVGQATRLAELALGTNLLDVREYQGVTITIVHMGGLPAYTLDTPALDPDPQYFTAPAALEPLFESGAAWGAAYSAELLQSGHILIHTQDSADDRRSKTIRVHIDEFNHPDAWKVVRIGSYAAPPAGPYGPARAPVQFTRPTYLPNLGLEISTPVDYRSWGVLSSLTDRGLDGRSLGYGSTDNGATYTRVIDTDDINLGRLLVERGKHLHHIEPFEWYDSASGAWNIGAIGLLGDGEGRAGQLILRYPGQSFRLGPRPDSPQPESPDTKELNHFEGDSTWGPTITRTKRVGLHLLTDIFPLNNIETPSTPLRYLAGADASQSGMTEMTIVGEKEIDRVRFRPTTSFPDDFGSANICSTPYVFQIGRVESQVIVAPTTEGQNFYDPNAMWVADPTGTHWTTAYAAHHGGWKGVTPIGGDRFWTIDQSVVGGLDEIWHIPPLVVREGLVLGSAASDLATGSAFANNTTTSSTLVTGQIDPPAEVPVSTPIYHVFSTSIKKGNTFDAGTTVPLFAPEGQLVQLAFWVKPAIPDLQVARLKVGLEVEDSTGTLLNAKGNKVWLDLNDWTRVVETVEAPAGGAFGARIELKASDAASADFPLSYYFTQPQILVSDQPAVQTTLLGTTTSEDRLSIPLDSLGAGDWTVVIWATEAPGLVASLVEEAGDHLLIENDNGPFGSSYTGTDSILRASWDDGSQHTIGDTPYLDIFTPAQSVVAVSHNGATSETSVFAARSMGEAVSLGVQSTPGWQPDELRFGNVDWSKASNIVLHRVELHDGDALTLSDFESHIKSFAPATRAFDPADANQDGQVNAHDVARVIFQLGQTGASLPADVNDDGVVNTADIARVILVMNQFD